MALGAPYTAAIAYRTDRAVPSTIGNIAQSYAGQVESPVALITKDHLPVGGGRAGSRGGCHWTVRRGSRRVLPAVALLAGLALGALPWVFRGTLEHLRRHADAGWMCSSPADGAANESFRFVPLIFVLRSQTDRT